MSAPGDEPATVEVREEPQSSGFSFGSFSSKMKSFFTKATPTLETMSSKWENATKKLDVVGRNIIQFVKTVTAEDYWSTPEALGIYYVTKRLVLMEFPDDVASKTPIKPSANPVLPSEDESIEASSRLSLVASYFNRYHAGQYMVYNLSERSYDTTPFHNQVIDFSFPGYPVPPLEKLFEILLSIYGWLRADKDNIAVVHCLTGYGRAALVLAAFMGWIGYQESSPRLCAELIASHLDIPMPRLLVPSQTRYLNYTSALLRGRYPSLQPLVLERVVLVGIPEVEQGGCRPYLQLYSQSKLVYTSTGREGAGALQWYGPDSGAVSFPVGVPLQGNFLLRLRHLSTTGQRVSVLRTVLHTGYIQPGSLRLRAQDLDGGEAEHLGEFWLELAFREAAADAAVISDGASKTAETVPLPAEGEAKDNEVLVAAAVTAASDTLAAKQAASDRFWARVGGMHKRRREEREREREAQRVKDEAERHAREEERLAREEEARAAAAAVASARARAAQVALERDEAGEPPRAHTSIVDFLGLEPEPAPPASPAPVYAPTDSAVAVQAAPAVSAAPSVPAVTVATPMAAPVPVITRAEDANEEETAESVFQIGELDSWSPKADTRTITKPKAAAATAATQTMAATATAPTFAEAAVPARANTHAVADNGEDDLHLHMSADADADLEEMEQYLRSIGVGAAPVTSTFSSVASLASTASADVPVASVAPVLSSPPISIHAGDALLDKLGEELGTLGVSIAPSNEAPPPPHVDDEDDDDDLIFSLSPRPTEPTAPAVPVESKSDKDDFDLDALMSGLAIPDGDKDNAVPTNDIDLDALMAELNVDASTTGNVDIAGILDDLP